MPEFVQTIDDIEITETHVKFGNFLMGLDDIKKASAPQMIIGVAPPRLPEGAGAFVVLEGFIGGSFKIIPLPAKDLDLAKRVVDLIQKAKNIRKQNQPVQSRVTVGECEQCHRVLRVKPNGIKSEMHLTCKCGHVNIINIPEKK
jgi:hypothetical protein